MFKKSLSGFFSLSVSVLFLLFTFFYLVGHELPVETFKFQISSAGDNLPLGRSHLIFSGPMIGVAKADNRGIITLKKIPHGRYQVSVYAPGYEAVVKTIFLNQKTAKKMQSIELEYGTANFSLYLTKKQILPGEDIQLQNYSKNIASIKLEIYQVKENQIKNFIGSPEGINYLSALVGETELTGLDLNYFSLVKEIGYSFDNSGSQQRNIHFKLNAQGLYYIKTTGVNTYNRKQTVVGKPMVFFISPLAAYLKISPENQLFLAANLSDNKPVLNGDLYFFSKQTQDARLVFDLQSLGYLKNGQINIKRQKKSGYYFLLSQNGEIAVQRTPYYYYEGENAAFNGVTTFLYSERPLYRPGDTIYFKGITFKRQKEGWVDFSYSKPLNVSLFNPNYEPIASMNVTIKNGSFSGEFIVPKNAPVGQYQLRCDLGETTFSVEEFIKPKYSLNVLASKTFAYKGEKILIKATGKYFFGAPLSRAAFKYTVYSKNTWSWIPWWEEDAGYSYDGYGYGDVVDTGSGILNEEGYFELPLTIKEFDRDKKLVIEFEVSDETGKTVVSSATITVPKYERSLSGYSRKWVYDKDDHPEFEIMVRNALGKPVPAKIKAQILNSRNQVVHEENLQISDSGEIFWKSNFKFPSSSQNKLWENYRLVLSTTDEFGQKVSTESNFYLSSYLAGNQNENDPAGNKLEMILDKNFYELGNTIFCYISSDRDSDAFLSLEGNDLYDYEWVKLKKGINLFKFKSGRHLLPTAALALHYFEQGYLRTLEKKIIFNNKKTSALEVNFKFNKEHYAPGEKVSVDIFTKTQDGKPMGANLSLAVVDEPIFALGGEPKTNIFDAFYKNFYSLVSTHYDRFLLGYYDYYGGLSKELSDVKLRKNFKDVVYWNPSIDTGIDGKAVVSFDLPDNLTQFRAVAVAYNSAAMFGAGKSSFNVKKELMVESALPAFFREGDHASLRAMIFNQSGQELKGAYEFLAENIPGSKTIKKQNNFRIKDNGREMIEMPIKLPAITKDQVIQVQMKAKADSFNDGELQPITVLARDFIYTLAKMPFKNYKSGNVVNTSFNTAGLDLTLISDLKLKVFATTDPAYLIIPSLKYLVHYPYGCVEQTMSSFLPNLYVDQIIKKRNLPTPDWAKNLKQYHEAGLKRLLDYQHADGGWGVWENDDTDLWHTSYVLYGFYEAQKQGVKIPREIVAKGLRSLISQMNNYYFNDNDYFYGSDPSSVFGHAVYTFGLYSKLNLQEYGFSKADLDEIYKWLSTQIVQYEKKQGNQISNSTKAQAYLYLYGQATGHKHLIQKYGKKLASRQKADGSFPGRDDQWFYWYSSPIEETALAMLAFEKSDNIKAVEKALDYLIKNSEDGHWHNTRETALAFYAIAAISDNPKLFSKKGSNITVSLNNKKLIQKNVKGGFEQTIPLTVKDLTKDNSLEFKNTDASLYSFLVLEGRYGGKLDKAFLFPQSTLKIKRSFYHKATAGEAGQWQPAITPSFKRGDHVKIKIEVTAPKNLRDVVIEAPLAAGLSYVGLNRSEQNYWYREEKRLDKVLYFFKELSEGTHTFEVDLQAQLEGKFSMPPALVQCMYRTEFIGYAPEETIEIR